jgi:hypothetical protein
MQHTNRGVVYTKPGEVQVQSIPYPKLRMPKSESDPFGGKDAPHGVILKVVTTNICGSDQHMVRGRTTAPPGLILGHEITGEIIEKGADVEMLRNACSYSCRSIICSIIITTPLPSSAPRGLRTRGRLSHGLFRPTRMGTSRSCMPLFTRLALPLAFGVASDLSSECRQLLRAPWNIEPMVGCEFPVSVHEIRRA